MFSLGKTVCVWAAGSANVLLDLANAGRAGNDALMLAVAAILAATRVAALLLFLFPAAGWLWKQFRRRDTRGILIFVIIASILFEIWAVPTYQNDADASAPDAAVTEQAEGG